MKPTAIDLCCGLGGWTEGLLAEGWHVIGYDIERHDYGTGGYPGDLILADITTLHGSQFKDASLFVASPPCQRYSYMAMPWSRAKAQAAMIEADTTGEELRKLNFLFDTCFRLQREASEAAGHHIPMIVENVRGAQKWVGRAAYHYGSFYLWGDVLALMPMTMQRKQAGRNFHFPEKYGIPSPSFHGADHEPSVMAALAMKTVGHANIRDGHSHTRHLTNQAESDLVRCSCPTKCDCESPDTNPALVSSECPIHNLNSRPSLTCFLHGELADGVKSDGSGWTEKGSLASHNRLVSNQGLKVPGISLSAGQSVGFNVTATQRYREGTKQTGISGPRKNGKGDKWFQDGSRSNSRKAASAMIAKIPYPLSQYIAHHFHPERYIP